MNREMRNALLDARLEQALQYQMERTRAMPRQEFCDGIEALLSLTAEDLRTLNNDELEVIRTQAALGLVLVARMALEDHD